ncbi:hypothetical protein DYB37_000745 [Aphanomyces astaci]|uniref:Uncharacterized protein n=1 Tax=Aphanomyces astaci TaxID=112090 RepID=A0A418F1M5_APHAT|nr:hypothetical protein DYB35_007387 [Aphanomyces astaci]RHZ22380.1 hypothetical protein DYB37_000745 [Aphanomyces astaci]
MTNAVYTTVALVSPWMGIAASSALAGNDPVASRMLKDKRTKRPKVKKPKTTTPKPTKKPKKKPKKTTKPATTNAPSKSKAKKSATSAKAVPPHVPPKLAGPAIQPAKVPLVAKASSSNLGGPTSQLSSGKDGMSTGTLAGIISAVVGGVALVTLVALFVVRKSRKEKQRRIKSVLENDFEEFEDDASTVRHAYQSTHASNKSNTLDDVEAAHDTRWASELVTEELQRGRRHSDVAKSMVSVNDTILLRGGTTDGSVLTSLVDMESDDSDSDDDDEDNLESPPPRGLAAPKKAIKTPSEFDFAELDDHVERGNRPKKSGSKETFL